MEELEDTIAHSYSSAKFLPSPFWPNCWRPTGFPLSSCTRSEFVVFPFCAERTFGHSLFISLLNKGRDQGSVQFIDISAHFTREGSLAETSLSSHMHCVFWTQEPGEEDQSACWKWIVTWGHRNLRSAKWSHDIYLKLHGQWSLGCVFRAHLFCLLCM